VFSRLRLADSVQEWRQLFTSSWRNFSATIQHIKGNIARNKRLIENRVSITQFEEIQNHQNTALHNFQRDKAAQEIYCRARVTQWLSPFNSEIEQDRHRRTRLVCKDPGRWLLNDPKLQKWFNDSYCSTPLLWLSGIPGAGMVFGGKTQRAKINTYQHLRQNHPVISHCRRGTKSSGSYRWILLLQAWRRNAKFIYKRCKIHIIPDAWPKPPSLTLSLRKGFYEQRCATNIYPCCQRHDRNRI